MKMINLKRKLFKKSAGFTLIELIIGSFIMLLVIIGALAVYSRSNRVTVDQTQYTELQHDVRSSLFLITRDIRMAGAGLPEEFHMFALEGIDNEEQGEEVKPDRLLLLGNMDEPFALTIRTYQGAGSSVELPDFSFDQYPYLDNYYEKKIVLILPNPASACRSGEIQTISRINRSGGGLNESIELRPATATDIRLPNGLLGSCLSFSDYNSGSIMFADVKEYWLDLTGNYPGLTPGLNGYIGNNVANILYMTKNGIHYPVAQNIENFQVMYNGDFSGDGLLDGFQDWNIAWTLDQIAKIRQVRIWVLGRTPNRFLSVSGKPSAKIHHYRRPAIANSPAAQTDDLHRRFLLETTVNIRNLSLGLHNRGER